MKVSVIIPTYNSKSKLELVLTHLLNQEFPIEKYELIIADDGSSDETRELVEKYMLKHDNIKYISQEDKGFRAGQARNLGASIAKGEFLIFLNDDIIPHTNLIQNYVETLEEHDIVLGYTAGYSGDKQYEKNELFNDIKDIRIIREFRHELFFNNIKKSSNTNPEIWTQFVATNYAIKKSVFDKEKYNESFIGWGGEDEEYGYRLLKNGYSMCLEKKCLGYHIPHEHEKLIEIYTKRKVESLIRNFIIFFEIHPNKDVEEHIFERYEHLPEEFKSEIIENYIKENIREIKSNILCNNNCIFCDNSLKISQNKNGFFCNRDIRENFLNEIKSKKEKGEEVIVRTNGRMFSIDKFAKIASKYIDKVILYYNSNDPEEHDRITQVKGSYKQTKKGEDNIRKYNIPLDVKYIEFDTNNPLRINLN